MQYHHKTATIVQAAATTGIEYHSEGSAQAIDSDELDLGKRGEDQCYINDFGTGDHLSSKDGSISGSLGSRATDGSLSVEAVDDKVIMSYLKNTNLNLAS